MIMPKDRQPSLADKKRLQKTQIIQMLLSQSPDKRNEYWQKQFFGNLPEAYLALRQPDVLQGPDQQLIFLRASIESKHI